MTSAFSAISQAGYLVLGVMGGTAQGMTALVYYLLVYLAANLGAFLIINIIIVMIIGAAAILAFLVLFNLTNINVTERIRELATLKVLGFYDTEAASYIYRENGFLTLIGTICGLFMGKWLHRWLIGTIEVDYLMFGRSVHPQNYVWAALLTFVFSLSVNLFSFFSIREIDMIESLKSVE